MDNSMPTEKLNPFQNHIRQLNALRKSVEDKLGEKTFNKWAKGQKEKAKPVDQPDPVADKIEQALKPLAGDKSIKLGKMGYSVKRAKGKGASGFVVEKILK
jgi:hypothetical protein